MTVLTDYYSQCETGVMNLMLTLTDYFPNAWQVSTDEFNINKGADYFLVFRPGKFPAAPVASGIPLSRNNPIRAYDWNMHADLYARYTEYETSWSNFKAVRNAILQAVGSDPALMFHKSIAVPGVTSFTVEGESEVVYWQKTKTQATPNFIFQTLRFVVRQTIHFNVQFVP